MKKNIQRDEVLSIINRYNMKVPTCQLNIYAIHK